MQVCLYLRLVQQQQWLFFNDGKFGIIPGSYCIDYCNQRDQSRIYQINRKEMGSVKDRWKQMQAILKRFSNQDGEKEGTTYWARELQLFSYTYCYYTTCHFVNLSDSNGTRTHNHLIRKQTPNNLAKLASLFTLKRVRGMIKTYRQSTPSAVGKKNLVCHILFLAK